MIITEACPTTRNDLRAVTRTASAMKAKTRSPKFISAPFLTRPAHASDVLFVARARTAHSQLVGRRPSLLRRVRSQPARPPGAALHLRRGRRARLRQTLEPLLRALRL